MQRPGLYENASEVTGILISVEATADKAVYRLSRSVICYVLPLGLLSDIILLSSQPALNPTNYYRQRAIGCPHRETVL